MRRQDQGQSFNRATAPIAVSRWMLQGLATAFLLGTAPAAAQQLPTREQVSPPPPTIAPPEPQVSIDSREALGASACPFEASPLTVRIDRIRITRPDGTALPPEIAGTLAKVTASALTGSGSEQPLSVVCAVRDAANMALRRDRWVASVQIPPQTVDDGELELVVVTGRITEVRVRGVPGRYARLLADRIDTLKSYDPLNEGDAEALLLAVDDVPGLDVQLSLRPAGTAPGDLIGELGIEQRQFALIGNAQNYNSRRLGRETLFLRGELYGLTGMGDVTYAGVSSSADFYEQFVALGGHIATLDRSGMTGGVRATYAISRPDLGLLDLRTDTLILGFDVARPLFRSVNRSLTAGFGFDYVDQETVVRGSGGATPLNEDKLRTFYARVGGTMQNILPDGRRAWFFAGQLEARQGVGLFGATPQGVGGFPSPSRPDGNARALVLRGDIEGEVGLGRIISFYAAASGQWTDDPLLNFDEYSVGSLTVGRGYDPGANSGDRAIGFTLEPRVTVPFGPVSAQLFSFYDHVELDNLDNFSTEQNRRLRSFGGGVRVTLPQAAILELTYASPQDKALTLDSGPPGDRLLLSLTIQFRR